MSAISRLVLAGAAAMLVCLMSASPARAGGGPEGVAVVVNAQSWASMAVANEYIHLRNIPPANVVYLNDVATFETIGVEEPSLPQPRKIIFWRPAWLWIPVAAAAAALVVAVAPVAAVAALV